MRYLIVFTFILCFFYACEDQSESETLLTVHPADLVKTAKAGEKILYTLTAFSNGDLIQNITLNTYDPDNGLQTVLDTTINREKIRLTYQYTVPQFSDTTDIKLRFTASSGSGFPTTVTRFVKVAGGEVKLEELTGITLYSTSSNQPDAFHIQSGQLINSHIAAIDSLQDILAWQDSTADENILSCEWRSPSGLKFARFNSFDYAAATQLNVENAYRSGIKLNYIRDLKPEDVILVGNDQHALGIIKIIYIFDDPGCTQDRYIFNIKRTKPVTGS